MTQVATFNLPWRIAFLPDGRMLVTEKVGPVWLVTQKGEKTPVAERAGRAVSGARAACWASISRRTTRPTTTSISPIPSRASGGSSLALARAKLTLDDGTGEPRRICR